MHALISSANIGPRHKNRCQQVLRESGIELTETNLQKLIDAAKQASRPSRLAVEEFKG